MSSVIEEEIKRWTARRKSALVLDIIHDLLPALGPGRTGKFGLGLNGESGGELGGRDIADRGVRPEMIVIDPPAFDLLPSVLERQEPVGIEALVPEAAVERLDERVVGRLAGTGVVHGHAVVVSPAIYRDRDELAAVIGLD